jgi:hypothetical protein
MRKTTSDENETRAQQLQRRRERLLTVKEYATVVRQHPQSVYRRISAGRQVGVHRIGGVYRLEPPDDGEDE